MADLSLTLTASFTDDNGFVHDREFTKTISNVTETMSGVVDVAAGSFRSIFAPSSGAAAPGRGALSSSDSVIIQNLDSTNFVTLLLTDGTKEYYQKIEAGGMFVLDDTEFDVDAAGGGFGAFTDIDDIQAQADTAECLLAISMFST